MFLATLEPIDQSESPVFFLSHPPVLLSPVSPASIQHRCRLYDRPTYRPITHTLHCESSTPWIKTNGNRMGRLGDISSAWAITLVFVMAINGASVRAQSNPPVEEKRQIKHLVQPVASDLAKKLNLTGTARIEVTIAPDGRVKRTRVLGGHPVLAAEAEAAAQKTMFEPGPRETIETMEFKF